MTSTLISLGRCGTISHPRSFCVAGVALMALGWLWCHTLSLSHTIFHTLSHTLSHTIFDTPSFKTLSHTTLSHTIFHHTTFHTQLCRTPSFTTPSFTHNFVAHHLPPHHLSHTTLPHTIFHIQLCHTHTQLCFTSRSSTTSFVFPYRQKLSCGVIRSFNFLFLRHPCIIVLRW